MPKQTGGTVMDFGTANEKQRLFFQSRTRYTAYGGARGGGKSWAVRVKAVGGALQWPGIRILIIRRTYPELQQNHIEPILRTVPTAAADYNGSLRTLYFRNGSTIRFGHAQSGTAMETEYQGQEYDWIFLDEATQFTESEFRTLGACLRGVNSIPKRFYLTCNPGGVGHQWVKRLFIDRQFKTGSADPEENEEPSDYSFIFATVEDNTALINSEGGKAYTAMLAQLPEHLRRAHRYGDWNALSGCYFPEFTPERHVIPAFVLPEHWTRYRSLDYGLDMLACVWVAVSPEGRCVCYREFTKSGLIVSEAARQILIHTLPGEQICATFAPPDLWSRQKDTGRSMAEIFFQNGVPLIRAGNDRVQGHLLIRELLAPDSAGNPGIRFFGGCTKLISDLRNIQADEADPNDCARVPHELTHTVDALRYFAVSRTLLPKPPKPEPEPDEIPSYESVLCGGEPGIGYM